jgi:tRNA A-37 threonylcarbamoyl transferase component Bud32
LNALAGAEKLAASNIATPEVYAALVSRCGWFRREYLVTGLLDDRCRILNKLPETECRQFITGKFIAMLKIMHDAGMSHGDLSLRNCYISVDGDPGLLDLDGAVCGKVSNRRRTVELARIISSFLLQFRKVDEAEKFTNEVLKIYGGEVVAAEILKAVEKFLQRGKKYL